MILVCAPTRVEARACRLGIADARARGFEVLRTGVGAARATAALEARLRAARRPDLIVSSGFAGALTPGIPLHAVVTATSLHRLDAGGAAPLTLPAGALQLAVGALPCHVASGAAVLIGGSPEISAPAALDMESAALADAAAAAGIPMAVLRVVTDTPDAPFPPFATDLGEALARPPGRARLAAAARAGLGAARRPLQALSFARSSLAAAQRLRAAWSHLATAEPWTELAG